ncbi:putative lipid II flippase FtsW [Virgibacillus soli]
MIKKLRKYDFTLLITPLLLAGFGLVMIYSASMVTAMVEGHEATYFLFRQLRMFLIGLVFFIFCLVFPYKNYQKLMKLIVLGIIAILLGVLLFGLTEGNASRWLRIGPIVIQPSEFAKLGIIMYLASVYSKKQSYIDKFTTGVLPPLIMTSIILGLIVFQPDIGTASTIFLIACTVIFSSGIKMRHLLLLASIGGIILLIAIPNMITDVRVSRFTGAYQPFEDPADNGYQLIQSYIAIGGGGITGEGLGQSVQKLGYLFGAHTDFIMSVIAEELGFFGVVIVIGLLSVIVLRGFYIARKCQDAFGSLLAIGISSMIGIQAFINLGAISGILPITGVTLPFISYGGSSLLVLLISMGILNNIASSVKLQRNDKEPNQHQPTQTYTYQGGKKWSS